MKKRFTLKYAIVWGLLLCSIHGMAQQSLTDLRKNSEFREYSEKAIHDLVDKGVLLVRVPAYEEKIKYWQRVGGEKGQRNVDKTIQKRDAQMAEIKAAFADFSICPVYFFMAGDSKTIKSGDYSQFNGIAPDLASKRIFIVDSQSFETASMNSTLRGFGVYNHLFEMLPSSFPNHVKKRSNLRIFGMERSYADMAKVLEERLREYHQQVTQPKK